MAPEVDLLVDQIKALSPEQQIQLAEAVDRLTWAARWRRICERIDSRARAAPHMGDNEIDREVAAVRKERPLSARSSTHRS